MNKKISELTAGGSPLSTDLIPIARGGDNYSLTVGSVGLPGIVNAKNYGAVGDGIADDTAALQAALAAAIAENGVLYLPLGTYNFASTLVVTGRVSIVGAGMGDPTGPSRAATILNKTADVEGILIQSSVNFVTLRDFTLTCTALAGTSDGIVVGEADHTNGSGHCSFSNLYLTKQRGSGFNARNGNTGRLDRIFAFANLGHGVCIDSKHLDVNNTNAWVLTNVSAIGNLGDGLHLGLASSNQVHGFDSEGNNGYGLYLDSTYNFASGYVEGNVTGSLYTGLGAFSNHVWIRSVGVGAGTYNNHQNYVHYMTDIVGYSPPWLQENGSLLVYASISSGAFNTAPVAGHVFIGASLGNLNIVTPSDGAAFQIDNPSGLVIGAELLTLKVKNATGGALGAIAWDAGYRLGSAWTSPADGYSRLITFVSDAGAWYEVSRSSSDVPN